MSRIRIARNFYPVLYALGLSSGMSQAWAAATDSTQPQASDPIKVDVVGKATDRDQRDYHDALKGVEVFNKFHSMAPKAELRFRLYPRREKLVRDGVQLHLKSDTVRRDIELGPDWVFDLPFDATVDKERGAMVTNRPEKSFAWRPYIRTPGLPENTRLLGDLRLECRVDIAAGLAVIPPLPANLALLASGADVCSMPMVHWDFFAEKPIFGVTLINKEKRLPLQTSVWLYANRVPLIGRPLVDFMLLDDRIYELPLADERWPDDTLVEFDYMDDVQAGPKQASAPSTQSAGN